MNSLLTNGWGFQIVVFLSGAAGVSVLAHAVNTFPTPKNVYGAWLLGVIQYAVGQRVVAKNTLQGLNTVATGVPNGKDP